MERNDYLILFGLMFITLSIGFFTTNQPVNQYVIQSTVDAFNTLVTMVWITWWALVLGFAIAGGVEAWVSSESVAEHFAEFGVKEISLASFFGFVSSSCSYSAIATAKNLFKKGSSAAASLGAFMFASTNLVIEIGFVILVLLGWEFVVGNFVGGIILIAFMAVVLEYVVPDQVIEEARENIVDAMETDPVCGMEVDPEDSDHQIEYNETTYHFCSVSCKNSFDPENAPENQSLKENLTSKNGWMALADKQWSEWGMLWKEIIVGFVFASLIAGFIPQNVWVSIFAQDSLGFMTALVWATVLGTIIGIITFVCSVGNVPFATVLWNGGLPFGGVFSYIYADLIVPPIVNAYRDYYGDKFGFILAGVIFVAAIVSGILTHLIFMNVGLIPTESIPIAEASIELDYKAVLNVLATIAFLGLYLLHKESMKDSHDMEHH